MTEQEAFENYIQLAPYDFQKVWAAACVWQREELAQQQNRKCEADPYAELKAAAKDPTKQIRCGKTGTWGDAGTAWTFERPVQEYEIRNKPKKMKLLAYITPDDGYLTWSKEGVPMTPAWKRVPSEDKEIEVEE